MTSPVEQIKVVCPRCGRVYEDRWRASINLQIEQVGTDYVEEVSTSTCPKCGHKVCHDVLVVREDGVWQSGPSDGRERDERKMKTQRKVRVPWFQPLSVVRGALKVYDGVAKSLIDEMSKTLNAQRGTPQNQVDWTNPEEWIDERLQGDQAALAWRFWREGNKVVNPRWLDGPDYLIRIYKLTQVDDQGIHRITDSGKAFLQNNPSAVRQIDEGEGMLKILSLLSARSSAKLSELLGEWSDFVREHSGFQADSSIRDALRTRLGDLRDRGLIKRVGHTYVMTDAGQRYLEKVTPPDPKQTALRAVKAFNDSQRALLHERLSAMPPYKFEQLVGELLVAMGYEDVEVTKQAGDKGIDVVATIQFGITTVTEVVQVKRHQSSIGREVIDQLRGALHYYSALRGTIITTGRFTKGCPEAALFPGAAPIGLIDGDRLLDLLFEHRIGLQERSATLLELDEAYFKGREQEEIDDSE